MFLLVLWDTPESHFRLRSLLLVLSGLSGPTIVFLLPIVLYRHYRFRQERRELILAALSVLLAAVQGAFLLQATGMRPKLDLLRIPIDLATFIGMHVSGIAVSDRRLHLGIGVLTCSLLLLALFKIRLEVRHELLVGLLAMNCIAVSLRAPLTILHPAVAGPRYFFLTYILLAWLIIHILQDVERMFFTISLSILLVGSLIQGLPVWIREDSNLQALKHARSCEFFEEYRFPVHSDGSLARSWSFQIEGSKCRELSEGSLVKVRSGDGTYFPYTSSLQMTPIEACSETIAFRWSSTVDGSSYSELPPPGCKIVGTLVTSDQDTGKIKLNLSRGSSVAYRSDFLSGSQIVNIEGSGRLFKSTLPSTPGWVVLTFSNQLLPKLFTVVIEDPGGGFGEWSAVMVTE